MLPSPLAEETPDPAYGLTKIKALVRAGRYRFTMSALRGATAMGLGRSDVEECVLGLEPAEFHKSMLSEKVIGLRQDVYRTSYEGMRIYAKLQVAGRVVIVISFKRR